MDVNFDKDLYDFIENLGKEEKERTSITANITESVLQTSNDNNTNENIVQCNIKATDSLWNDITNACESWSSKVLDAESNQSTSATFQQTIEDSLRRQQLDGFLCSQDLSELRYVAQLWTELLNASSCYALGCIFVKRKILTILLELYTLKQITNDLFIDACLKL